jgi:hypothetical protein
LADKLPVDAAVNSVLRHVKSHEANGNWEEATQIYTKLLEFATKSDSARCPFKVKAVAAVVEFSRSLSLAIQLWSQQERDIELLEKLKQELIERVETSVEKDILGGLQMMYDRQNRLDGLQSLMPGTPSDGAEFPEYLGYTSLHKAIFSRKFKVTDSIKKYINKGDLLDWTPLHYAVVRGYQSAIGYVFEEQFRILSLTSTVNVWKMVLIRMRRILWNGRLCTITS